MVVRLKTSNQVHVAVVKVEFRREFSHGPELLQETELIKKWHDAREKNGATAQGLEFVVSLVDVIIDACSLQDDGHGQTAQTGTGYKHFGVGRMLGYHWEWLGTRILESMWKEGDNG